MKNKELDVDFIGDQKGLTEEEEKAISDFINSKKTKEQINRSQKPVSAIKEHKRRLPELAK